MLIIESRDFLLPVVFFIRIGLHQFFVTIAYYNAKSNTLLSGNKYFIEEFEKLKNGLGNIHALEKKEDKYQLCPLGNIYVDNRK